MQQYRLISSSWIIYIGCKIYDICRCEWNNNKLSSRLPHFLFHFPKKQTLFSEFICNGLFFWFFLVTYVFIPFYKLLCWNLIRAGNLVFVLLLFPDQQLVGYYPLLNSEAFPFFSLSDYSFYSSPRFFFLQIMLVASFLTQLILLIFLGPFFCFYITTSSPYPSASNTGLLIPGAYHRLFVIYGYWVRDSTRCGFPTNFFLYVFH